MSHQTEIYDFEPFNFEMIFNRYMNFENQNSAIKIVQRSVILKAFERIKVTISFNYFKHISLIFLALTSVWMDSPTNIM